MGTHAIITRWDADGRINKAISNLTSTEAVAQLPSVQSQFNAQAFIVAHSGDLNQRDYSADPVAKTIMFNPLPAPPKPTVISYEDFQNRFTQVEQDLTTEYVEEINLTNGKPKRPALKQAMMRVTAKGTVDLTEARTAQFCQALVADGVITSQRKTEILTP